MDLQNPVLDRIDRINLGSDQKPVSKEVNRRNSVSGRVDGKKAQLRQLDKKNKDSDRVGKKSAVRPWETTKSGFRPFRRRNPIWDGLDRKGIVQDRVYGQKPHSDSLDQIKTASEQVEKKNPISDHVDRKNLHSGWVDSSIVKVARKMTTFNPPPPKFSVPLYLPLLTPKGQRG